MTPRSVTQAFAEVTAALTSGRDVTDTLDRLVRDSAEVLGAQAVGLLIKVNEDELELLSATSHQIAELELFQIQHDTGPCIEAIRTGSAVTAASQDDIRVRWPRVGAAIAAAGYTTVRAYPLCWRGRAIGALNTFHTREKPAAEDTGQIGQALADIATTVIIQASALTAEQIAERVQEVLQARTLIEQAKGVLAYTRGVDMAMAYDLLRHLAADRRATITDTAASVIADAQRKNLP
jgi:transcriptional regulator with GAF, ATPase, and Fis domain